MSVLERPTPKARRPIERLRKLCMALPGVTEKQTHGESGWFVKKQFVMTSDMHHDDRIGFWCAAPPGVQSTLCAREPERYYRPPYVGHRGWIGVYLDVTDPDWDAIADLVEDGWRMVATKKLLAELDARS